MAEIVRPLLGWPFLPLPDEQGVIDWPGLEQSVRDAIRIVLSTRPQIRDLVQNALTRWERRILLDGVEVWELPDQPSHVRVEIAYRLARNGAPGAMNVTLQLEGR